jgi:DNA polymerase III delta prime subunit
MSFSKIKDFKRVKDEEIKKRLKRIIEKLRENPGSGQTIEV